MAKQDKPELGTAATKPVDLSAGGALLIYNRLKGAGFKWLSKSGQRSGR